MFKMTASAQSFLQETINKEKQTMDEVLYLRLSMGIGWGAPKLNLSLEERMIKGDLSFEFGDLTIIIHENDYAYFNGTMLEYVKDDLGTGRFQLLKA